MKSQVLFSLSKPARQRGFTLLEAVIAMAIFAMGASALYSWLNTNLITLARADAINSRSSALESAIDFMSRVDPVENPEGSVDLGGLHIQWKVQDFLAEADVIDEQNKKTINQASLLPTQVSVYRNERLLHEFSIVLLGIKQVREIGDVIFE